MTLSLKTDFTTEDTDYIPNLNANFAAIESEVNNLSAQLVATIGEGGPLIVDLFDRDGIIGAHSYVLDIENYPGGSQITIGRRPAPVFQGEVDESAAWGTFSGQKARVTLSGDLLLDAVAIVSALPKTIFIGIPSSGTPQFFEDDVQPNVLYIYEMTWNGFELTEFARRAPILPGYSLIQEIAAAPRLIQVFDSDTSWIDDFESRTEIVLPGHSDDNEIGVDASMEVVGFFISTHNADDDGFAAPGSNPPTDSIIRLEVQSEAVRLNLEDLELDAGQTPDTIYAKVDPATDPMFRFVTEVRRFRLVREFLGTGVTSARGFTWGLIVRPMIGTPIPKNQNKVIQI